MSALELQHRLGNLLAHHLAAANLLGRMQVLRDATARTGKQLPLTLISQLAAEHSSFADESAGQQAITDQLAVGFSFDLPDQQAVEHLRNLVPVTREVFDGLTGQYRGQAFTLAGTADQRLIEKVRNALADIAAKGGTQADFRQAVGELTTEAGAADISSFTLDTAFNTAMQKAYSLGRREQMSSPATTEVLPIWQYWTVGDSRVRPEHRVLHKFAARADDPVWMKIYPPSGFNCRCSVAPLLASEAPKSAFEPGFERLPLLAVLLVPQAGFR